MAFVTSVAFAAFGAHAHAAETSLYDRILDLGRRELQIDASGERWPEWEVYELLEYVLPSITERGTAEFADIVDLLKGGNVLCDREKLNLLSECPSVRDAAEVITRREERTRALGRDLQIIASGFEQPLLGGFALPATARMEGVARMWRADIGDADADAVVDRSGMHITTQEVTDAFGLEGLVRELGDVLKKAIHTWRAHTRFEDNVPSVTDASRLIAAVNRYRFAGVRWLRGKRPEFPPPPEELSSPSPFTESELLRVRHGEIENALETIADRLIAEAGDDEFASGEIIMFNFPKALTDLLPDNVLPWAYVEKLADGTISGDAGLQWAYALEPTPPTLCSFGAADGIAADRRIACVPMRGGRYPPAPKMQDEVVIEEGITPLCMYPTMRSGLLCKAPEDGERGICAKTVEPDPEIIQLTVCEGGEAPRETEIGGDACGDSAWQANRPQAFDPFTQCHITLSCGDNPFDALTKKKDANGNIPIIMQDTPDGSPIHLLLHELVHAQQVCNLPPGTAMYEGQGERDKLQTCCRIEGDAYRVQCDVMAQDGVFDGTQFNADTCTQILTDFSCRDRIIEDGGGEDLPLGSGACPWSMTFSNPSFKDVETLAFEVIGASERWMQEKNARADEMGEPEDRTPENCTELLPPPPKRRDPRIDAAVAAIEGSGRDVCTPLQKTTFRNTIGNAMCFLNRCWKESLTDHQLIPGRVPATSGDGAFPFAMCMAEDPAFGKIIPGPSEEADWLPPPYRPAQMLRELEETLCPGQPLGSPLCGFDPARRVGLPVRELTQFAGSMLDQEQQFQEPGMALRQLSEAIGIRIGTRLYQDFLQSKARTLTDFTTEASTLLAEFPRARFPATLCSMNDADGEGLLGTEFCGMAAPSSASSSSSP